MWPMGRLNRSEPSSHDEWGHSFKMIVNYEDDYLKNNIISKQNHVVFLAPKSLAYIIIVHRWIAIVTLHLPTLKWNVTVNAAQWSMTGWISTIISIILHKIYIYIYDNIHTLQNLLAAFHCFRVLFFSRTPCTISENLGSNVFCESP